MVRGKKFPQPSFHTTTSLKDGDCNWDKVSPEFRFDGHFCWQMHTWLLLPVEALGDGLSSSTFERPPPWTLTDKDMIHHLPEHEVCWVSGLEQVLEQIEHDKQTTVSNLMSYMHCWPSHECYHCKNPHPYWHAPSFVQVSK